VPHAQRGFRKRKIYSPKQGCSEYFEGNSHYHTPPIWLHKVASRGGAVKLNTIVLSLILSPIERIFPEKDGLKKKVT
jgi:hypothetical protein